MSEYVDLAEVRKAIQDVNAKLGTSPITLQLVLEKVKSLKRVNANQPVDLTTVLAYEAGQRTGGVVLDDIYWGMILGMVDEALLNARQRGFMGEMVRLTTIKNTIENEMRMDNEEDAVEDDEPATSADKDPYYTHGCLDPDTWPDLSQGNADMNDVFDGRR